MPVDTSVTAGDTAVLQCLPPRGSPRPTVSWAKGGRDFTSNGQADMEGRVSVSEQGNLVIRCVYLTNKEKKRWKLLLISER